MRILSKPAVVLPLIAMVLLVIASAACSDDDNEPPTESTSADSRPHFYSFASPSTNFNHSSRVHRRSPRLRPLPNPAGAPQGMEEKVQLPHDEGVHLSDLEWFYFNGHLTAENGQEFSYHFVTFQTVQPSGLTSRLAQLSWADHADMLHLTGEKAAVPLPVASSGEFDLQTGDWRMSGDGEEYQLSFGVGEYTVELEGRFAEARRAAPRVRAGRPWCGGQDLLLLTDAPGDLRHGDRRRRFSRRYRGVLDGPPVGRVHDVGHRMGLAQPES